MGLEELIEPHPRFSQYSDYFEVKRAGNEIVWRRHDKDGATLQLVFSTDACTNLVSLDVLDAPSTRPITRSRYRWIQRNGKCQLAEMETSQTFPNRPKDLGYVFKLRVLECSNDPGDITLLNPARYLESLPPGTLVEDNVRDRTYRINSARQVKPDRRDDWGRLIELVKHRGFLAD